MGVTSHFVGIGRVLPDASPYYDVTLTDKVYRASVGPRLWSSSEDDRFRSGSDSALGTMSDTVAITPGGILGAGPAPSRRIGPVREPPVRVRSSVVAPRKRTSAQDASRSPRYRRTYSSPASD